MRERHFINLKCLFSFIELSQEMKDLVDSLYQDYHFVRYFRASNRTNIQGLFLTAIISKLTLLKQLPYPAA